MGFMEDILPQRRRDAQFKQSPPIEKIGPPRGPIFTTQKGTPNFGVPFMF